MQVQGWLAPGPGWGASFSTLAGTVAPLPYTGSPSPAQPAGSPTPGGPGQPAFQDSPARPARRCPGPGSGCLGVTVWSVLGPASSRRAQRMQVKRACPFALPRENLAAEHAGGLLEKVKQDEEPGSFLLGAKACQPARDGHARGSSILLPPRTRHV